LTRVSILYLLLRLTPHTSPKSRLFLHLVIAASYSFIVVNLGIIIFECKPITAAWDIKSRLTPGTCLGANTINLYAGLCAGHIVLDMMTILPPIPIIARLSMSRTKKLNLYLLLALGLVSVCCTSVRMFVYYRKVVQNYDKTRKYFWPRFFSISCFNLYWYTWTLTIINRRPCRCRILRYSRVIYSPHSRLSTRSQPLVPRRYTSR